MDIQRLLNGFLGSVDGSSSIGEAAQKLKTGGVPGGLLGGAAAGGLIATLVSSKKARKFGGKALTYGGLAVLGGLAYKAWNDHRRTLRRVRAKSARKRSLQHQREAASIQRR